MIKKIEDYNYTININGEVTNIKTNKVLKQYINQRRVLVELWKNNKKKHFLVHRLIAKAFIPNPDNKPQINHINGNSLDNRIENLEWVTDSENKYHAYQNNLKSPKCIAVFQYDLNGNRIKKFRSILDAYKETKVDRKSIKLNLKNKYKQAGGYVWKIN